jgi:hypothetical protein
MAAATESRRFVIRFRDPTFSVWDTAKQKVVFRTFSESSAISVAQKRCGLHPIDGNPQTYQIQKTRAREA